MRTLHAVRAVLAIAVCAWAPSVMAQGGDCPAAMHAWVDGARTGLGVALAIERCPHVGAFVINVASPDAPLLHVEIATGEGDALYRVGRVRVNPMVDVPDWSHTFASHRHAVAALVDWLGTHPLPPDPPASAPIAARDLSDPAREPWLPLAVLMAFVALAVCVRPSRRALAIPFAIASLAGVLHVTLGSWGVFHVNGQGPLWLSGALHDRHALAAYGSGYPDLFAGFARLHASDRAVFAANGVAWGGTVALTFALARRLGLRTLPAALAASGVAVDPIALRFVTTESYFPAIVLLTTAGTFALADAAATSRPLRAAVALIAAVLALALVVRIHPVAWVPAALSVCTLVALPNVTWRRRVGVALGAGVGALMLAGRDVLRVHAHMAHGLARPFVAPRPALIVVGALVAAVLAVRPASRRFVVPFGVHVLAIALLDDVFAQSLLSRLAFDHLFVVIPVIACASFLPATWDHGRARTVTVALAATLAAGCLLVARPMIRARTTDAREYAWLRTVLPHLPVNCTVDYVARAGRRVMVLAEYLPGPHVHALEAGEPLDPSTGACTRYVRTTLCAAREAESVCNAVEARVSLYRLASQRFPAVPSDDALGYPEPTVESTLFAVGPPLSNPTLAP